MPEYPLDPRKEMSEAEYMGYLQLDERTDRRRGQGCRACRDGGSRHADWCEFDGRAIERRQTRPSDQLIETFAAVYGRELLGAGFSILRRLRGHIWQTQAGQTLTVDQMGLSHVQNLIRWLERRAEIILIAAQVEIACTVVDHNGGEMAHDSLEQAEAELHEMNAMDYLRSTELYKALQARL